MNSMSMHNNTVNLLRFLAQGRITLGEYGAISGGRSLKSVGPERNDSSFGDSRGGDMW